jgi:hypothetical protein
MQAMFSLCWPLTLLCHVSNEKGAFLAHVFSIVAGLYYRFFQHQVSWIWLGLHSPPFKQPPQIGSWDFWIWAIS